MPIAASISFIRGTCSFSSSAIGFLVPLYSGYIVWRNVGSCTSKATVKYSGCSSSNILNKIFKNPNTAFVWIPSELVKSRTPKNARFKILCPSIKTIFLLIFSSYIPLTSEFLRLSDTVKASYIRFRGIGSTASFLFPSGFLHLPRLNPQARM